MVDTDKVIKAWEIFRDSNPYQICEGIEFRAISEPAYCMSQMIADTLELLKEKQPRVLTFEELDALPNETDIWGETKGCERIYAQTTFDFWFSPARIFRKGVFTGKLRYWTARPTKEQREAVPW